MPKAEGVQAAGSSAGVEDVGAGTVMLGSSGGVGACSVGKSILGTLKAVALVSDLPPSFPKISREPPWGLEAALSATFSPPSWGVPVLGLTALALSLR